MCVCVCSSVYNYEYVFVFASGCGEFVFPSLLRQRLVGFVCVYVVISRASRIQSPCIVCVCFCVVSYYLLSAIYVRRLSFVAVVVCVARVRSRVCV